MFAIYKYENGLRFIGVVSETVEKCEEYLEKTYGRNETTDFGYTYRIPYNKNTFEIKEIEVA